MAEEGEVRINFRTSADLKGAQDTAKALGNVEKAAGPATTHLGRLREVGRGLAREFPLLGRAFTMAVHPISLLVASLSMMVKVFLDVRRTAKESDEAFQKLGATIRQLRNAAEIAREVAAAMSDYNKAIADAGASKDVIGDRLERQLDLLEKVTDAQKKAGLDPESLDRNASNLRAKELLAAENAYTTQMLQAQAAMPAALTEVKRLEREPEIAAARVKYATGELARAESMNTIGFQIANILGTGMFGLSGLGIRLNQKKAARVEAARANLQQALSYQSVVSGMSKAATGTLSALSESAQAGAAGAFRARTAREQMFEDIGATEPILREGEIRRGIERSGGTVERLPNVANPRQAAIARSLANDLEASGFYGSQAELVGLVRDILSEMGVLSRELPSLKAQLRMQQSQAENQR